jgi:creatinine amidohydrolase/Fe(II)-dependent formamide hydrolase-like protein
MENLPMSSTKLVLLIASLLPIGAFSQVLMISELSVRDIERLNRDQTVVIIPGGNIEEHGPYLPSFTDGYLNEWLASRTAEAIIAERGGTVLMFPTIPLGVGSPEDFGGLSPFSGSYTVRPETLRAVYMDLANALGEDGFRTIFIVNRHGAPAHNKALLEAADYFNERFDGTMAVLTSLIHEDGMRVPNHLTSKQNQENGVDVHSGEEETSQMLFLKPGLVHDDYTSAAPVTANSPDVLTEIAERPGWPGYFGSPRVATPTAGAMIVEYRTSQTIDLALRILDGFDWRGLSTRADRSRMNSSFRTADANNIARAGEERRRQEIWLESDHRPKR